MTAREKRQLRKSARFELSQEIAETGNNRFHCIRRRIAQTGQSQYITVYTEQWRDISGLIGNLFNLPLKTDDKITLKLPYATGFNATDYLQTLLQSEFKGKFEIIEN